MSIQAHSLRKYNTFGINVKTRNFIVLSSVNSLLELIEQGSLKNKKLLILGSGSNILFKQDYDGIIIHPVFNKIAILEEREDEIDISAEAGVIWDDLVKWTVSRNYGGLENLSYIPGTVGAAPIQNIGAYGSEFSDTVLSVETIRIDNGKQVLFRPKDCNFAYRSSIFKNELAGQYLVHRVSFRLHKNPGTFNVTYGMLEKRVGELGETNLKNIRNALIAIRKEKLPEPGEIGNAGSFFKNPLINSDIFNTIKNDYPDIPYYNSGDSFKIPAAWLIEQCGWKGFRDGDAGVHKQHALILVNHGLATGKEIYDLSEKIILSVKQKFAIELKREVRVI